MKLKTINFFALVLVALFITLTSNSFTTNNIDWNTISMIHFTYDSGTGNLLLEWEDHEFDPDCHYNVYINGGLVSPEVTSLKYDYNLAEPIYEGMEMEICIEKVCEGATIFKLCGTTLVVCEEPIPGEVPSSEDLPPGDFNFGGDGDDSCCIVATSDNINGKKKCPTKPGGKN